MTVRTMRGVRLFVSIHRSRIEIKPSFDWKKAGSIVSAVLLAVYRKCQGGGVFVPAPIFDLKQVQPAHPAKLLVAKPFRT